MATELGSAFISVGMGTNTLAGDVKKAFGGAESSGSDAGKSAGKGFGGAFGIAAAAVGALGIGTFFKSAVSGAANLEQSVGAVDAVFKGSAGQMHDWAKSAATDVGLTQNEFNELGTLIGSQLKNGGTAMDELGPKTKNLIGTGADLASMFGGTTSDAVAALSSALKGERDPIEKYGVSLNQAKIDAEAAALGFDNVKDSSAQQAATLSLIMKQTADAQGNFGRETDTLAHKQQVLNAQWQDGKAAIGAALLPAVSAATGALSSALGPAMAAALSGTKELVGGFTAMGAAFEAGGNDVTSDGFAGGMERIGLAARQAFDGVKPLIQSLAASFGPLIPQVLQLASSFSPLGMVFKAIQPILPELAVLFGELGWIISQTLSTTLTQLMPIVSMFVAQLSSMAIQLMPAVAQIVGMLGETLATLTPIIGQVIAQIAPLVMSLMTQLAPIIISLVTSILPPLVSIFGQIVAAIGPLVTVIMGLLIPIIQALMPVVVTVFGVIANVITSAMTVIQGIIEVVTGIISGNWERVWSGVLNIVSGVFGLIVDLISGAIHMLISIIGAGLNIVVSVFTGAVAGIVAYLSASWRSITDGAGRMLGDLVNFFGSIGGKILGALGNIGGLLFSTGVNIIQGLINGIGSMMGAIGRAVLSIVPEAIRGPFEQLLGIHSPSRVFMGYGVNIGQGLINGLDGMHGKIASSVEGLVTVPPVPSFGAGSYSASLGAASGALSPSFNVYVGNEQLDARTYRVANTAITSTDSDSRFMRTGRR